MARNNETDTVLSYEVTESPVSPLRFGLAARANSSGAWITVAEEPAFTESRTDSQSLADLCTASHLSPTHLTDVVLDYLTAHELELEKTI